MLENPKCIQPGLENLSELEFKFLKDHSNSSLGNLVDNHFKYLTQFIEG